ncbi:chemotaxis-specific protein-glutamate methyltransferase CheB [Pseudoblastomonas halimionae]|nr:chemotaxis-specific protein-glutamate methyltransferase CheB [Alteriqipengyuania halimionae]
MSQAMMDRRPSFGRRSSSRTIRMMIVDDSVTARSVLIKIVAGEDDLEVVEVAGTAEEAIEKLKQVRVDLILLDLEMPGMGGLRAMPQILELSRGARVLVNSALTEKGAKATLSALSMGAADTLLKPRPGKFDDAYRANLIEKIRVIGSALSRVEPASFELSDPPARPAASRGRAQVIGIGASTGGIHALTQMLKSLPKGLGVPILVTQHLPASFMQVFARQLELAYDGEAVVAEDGMPLRADRILIAPGEAHMGVRRGSDDVVVAALSHDKASSGCLPSVDPLFASMAECFGDRALGVVLSGMGRDGAIGAKQIHEVGGVIIAQDQESSAVWGMPRAVAEAGIAAAVETPDKIGARIAEMADPSAWR